MGAESSFYKMESCYQLPTHKHKIRVLDREYPQLKGRQKRICPPTDGIKKKRKKEKKNQPTKKPYMSLFQNAEWEKKVSPENLLTTGLPSQEFRI